MVRRVTVSCPGCGGEQKEVTIDVAEQVLLHGCTPCREKTSGA